MACGQLLTQTVLQPGYEITDNATYDKTQIMDIVLCGSKDLISIAGFFKNVVEDFGARPRFFGDSTIFGSNNRDWPESSKITVLKGDIIVYVIVKDYGEITWETEFVTAKNEGKQMLILCNQQTYDDFENSRSKGEEIFNQIAAKNKIFHILEYLMDNQFNVITYPNDKFERKLKTALLDLFQEGIENLARTTQKGRLQKLIKENNIDTLKKKLKDPRDREYLFEILDSNFENKEIRKRILDLFCISKDLTNDQIIRLIKDPEQGVARHTIDRLHQLISSENNIDEIFAAAIELANNSDDVGIDRRIVMSLLQIDVVKAMNHLKEIFPVSDIGTPKRILAFLHSNEITLNEADTALMEELVLLCNDHQTSTDTLKGLVKKVAKKYDLNIDDTPSEN